MEIVGYCSCCGEPNYKGLEISHDVECICYDKPSSKYSVKYTVEEIDYRT